MSGVELKPCPFCGGAASDSGYQKWSKPHCETTWVGGRPITEAFFCNCPSCGINNMTVGIGYETQAEAIAAWNRRTPDPAQIRADALREAMGPINYWLDRFGHVQIKHVSAQKYATDAILDIQDAILVLIDTPLSPTAVDDSPAPDAGGKEGA